MARKLRYYEKKRGHRRTGSNTLGNAGEALFFAVFLLLGCGGFVVWLLFLVIPQWQVNHEFLRHQCTVLDSRIAEKKGEDGTLYRPEIKIKYQVDGVNHFSWTYDIDTVRDHASSYSSGREQMQALLDRFVVDKENPKQYPCWYDPADPRIVVLARGYSWWIWLILAIPISFILIGGGGLIYSLLHWGKSAERRAAMARRAQQRDLFGTNGGSQRDFPNIPDGANIINSPGTRLKFRLPIATSPAWALFGALVACLLWNGIVSVFVALAIRSHIAGQPDWFLTLFIIPFVLGGIALIGFFVRQFLVATGIGPTLVEISDHPLRPGKHCRIFVSQSGRLTVNSIEVLLVCEEEATYRQGTNTRTETREVHRQEVFRRDEFEVRPGSPFEAECELAVPAGAMHSFKADHNEIHWKLVVRGNVDRWPDYVRSFPLIVCPVNGRNDT